MSEFFSSDSQPSKGSNLGFRSGSWSQESRLAVQSSGIRLARVDLINSGWIRMDTTNSGALGKYFWERMEMIIIGQGYSVLLLYLRLEWLDWIRMCSVVILRVQFGDSWCEFGVRIKKSTIRWISCISNGSYCWIFAWWVWIDVRFVVVLLSTPGFFH